MKKLLIATLVLGLLGGASLSVQASPEQDLKEFRAYFKNRFPGTPFNDYINGVYSIDAACLQGAMGRNRGISSL